MQRRTDQASPSQRILNTAFECLSTRGYANVSIRNIADEAGVALGQMTYYYRNKETLFLEVIDMMMRQYVCEIEKRLEAAPDNKQKLAALVEFFRELAGDNPKLLRLFIDFTAQALWIPSFREQLDSLLDRLAKLIEKNLPEDRNAGKRYSEHSPQSVSKLILGALLGTSIQIMLSSDKGGPFESLSLAESLLD